VNLTAYYTVLGVLVGFTLLLGLVAEYPEFFVGVGLFCLWFGPLLGRLFGWW
jgi:hypothetical protein